jgi:hypothetical protein
MPSNTRKLPEPASAARPDAFERLFPYAWLCFQLAVWAWAAVWWEPGLLDFVGARASGDWLERHLWFRLLWTPILVPLVILSAFQTRKGSGRRLTPEELADEDGSGFADDPGMDLAGGFPEGDAQRVPLDPWVMQIGTWSRKGERRTVARIGVEITSSFRFLARSARDEPAFLRGVQRAAMSYAIRRAVETNPDARATGVAESMAWLGEPPLTIGDDALDRFVLLRANHPDAARALLKATPVARALAALADQVRHWEWTCYPTRVAGRAELMLECSGSMGNGDRIGLARALMSAALEHLASAGTIRPDTERAA